MALPYRDKDDVISALDDSVALLDVNNANSQYLKGVSANLVGSGAYFSVGDDFYVFLRVDTTSNPRRAEAIAITGYPEHILISHTADEVFSWDNYSIGVPNAAIGRSLSLNAQHRNEELDLADRKIWTISTHSTDITGDPAEGGVVYLVSSYGIDTKRGKLVLELVKIASYAVTSSGALRPYTDASDNLVVTLPRGKGGGRVVTTSIFSPFDVEESNQQSKYTHALIATEDDLERFTIEIDDLMDLLSLHDDVSTDDEDEDEDFDEDEDEDVDFDEDEDVDFDEDEDEDDEFEDEDDEDELGTDFFSTGASAVESYLDSIREDIGANGFFFTETETSKDVYVVIGVDNTTIYSIAVTNFPAKLFRRDDVEHLNTVFARGYGEESGLVQKIQEHNELSIEALQQAANSIARSDPDFELRGNYDVPVWFVEAPRNTFERTIDQERKLYIVKALDINNDGLIEFNLLSLGAIVDDDEFVADELQYEVIYVPADDRSRSLQSFGEIALDEGVTSKRRSASTPNPYGISDASIETFVALLADEEGGVSRERIIGTYTRPDVVDASASTLILVQEDDWNNDDPVCTQDDVVNVIAERKLLASNYIPRGIPPDLSEALLAPIITPIYLTRQELEGYVGAQLAESLVEKYGNYRNIELLDKLIAILSDGDVPQDRESIRGALADEGIPIESILQASVNEETFEHDYEQLLDFYDVIRKHVDDENAPVRELVDTLIRDSPGVGSEITDAVAVRNALPTAVSGELLGYMDEYWRYASQTEEDVDVMDEYVPEFDVEHVLSTCILPYEMRVREDNNGAVVQYYTVFSHNLKSLQVLATAANSKFKNLLQKLSTDVAGTETLRHYGEDVSESTPITILLGQFLGIPGKWDAVPRSRQLDQINGFDTNLAAFLSRIQPARRLAARAGKLVTESLQRAILLRSETMASILESYEYTHDVKRRYPVLEISRRDTVIRDTLEALIDILSRSTFPLDTYTAILQPFTTVISDMAVIDYRDNAEIVKRYHGARTGEGAVRGFAVGVYTYDFPTLLGIQRSILDDIEKLLLDVQTTPEAITRPLTITPRRTPEITRHQLLVQSSPFGYTVRLDFSHTDAETVQLASHTANITKIRKHDNIRFALLDYEHARGVELPITSASATPGTDPHYYAHMRGYVPQHATVRVRVWEKMWTIPESATIEPLVDEDFYYEIHADRVGLQLIDTGNGHSITVNVAHSSTGEKFYKPVIATVAVPEYDAGRPRVQVERPTEPREVNDSEFSINVSTVRVAGDGNCGIYAFLDSLDELGGFLNEDGNIVYNLEVTTLVRLKIYEEIAQNIASYMMYGQFETEAENEAAIEDFAIRMLNDGAWLWDIHLQALANAYNAYIFVFTDFSPETQSSKITFDPSSGFHINGVYKPLQYLKPERGDPSNRRYAFMGNTRTPDRLEGLHYDSIRIDDALDRRALADKILATADAKPSGIEIVNPTEALSRNEIHFSVVAAMLDNAEARVNEQLGVSPLTDNAFDAYRTFLSNTVVSLEGPYVDMDLVLRLLDARDARDAEWHGDFLSPIVEEMSLHKFGSEFMAYYRGFKVDVSEIQALLIAVMMEIRRPVLGTGITDAEAEAIESGQLQSNVMSRVRISTNRSAPISIFQ